MILFYAHLPTTGTFSVLGLPEGFCPPRSISDSLRGALEEKGWQLQGRAPHPVLNAQGQQVATIRLLVSGPAWAWTLQAPQEQLDAIEVWVGMRACQLRQVRTGKDLYNPWVAFLGDVGAEPAGPRGVYQCTEQQWTSVQPVLASIGCDYWAWQAQAIK